MSGTVRMRDAVEASSPDPHVDRLARFVRFFCTVMQQPDPLRDADCRESYREYVPRYYQRLFGPGVDGLSGRHLEWLERLLPVLDLPPGATVLDCGGGYGLDSIFLAACGYDVVSFELTRHHIGVCRYLQGLWEQAFGALRLRCVLAVRSGGPAERLRANAAAIGAVDAVLLDEVAHHVEPVRDLFALCAAVLPRGGALFLLEPNFWSPIAQAHFFRTRGLRTVEPRVDEETGERYRYGNEHIRPRRTWQRLAADAGFRLRGARYIVPSRTRAPAPARWRTALQTLPLVKSVAATHVTLHFEKA